ncbi:MAG: MFS transporter, partial [bacterium]
MALRIRRSLRASFWDGFFASIQFGIIDQFATPLAMFMGADKIAIGFLHFVRSSLVSVVQYKASDITAALRSRKKLILFSVFIAALLWLPAYFLPFLFPNHKVLLFIALFTLASCFNMLATPAWASLMAEYVPAGKRGHYFGWRNSLLGTVYTVSVILAGLLLHYFTEFNLFLGFAILVSTASLTRFVSWMFLTRMYEPSWRVTRTDYFSFGAFIGRIRASNFARFAVICAFFMFSVSLVSPFFAVFLIEELGLDYWTFTLIITAAVITSFVGQRYWGDFADKYGNMRMVRLA